MRYIPPDLEPSTGPDMALANISGRASGGMALNSSLYSNFFGGSMTQSSVLTQASFADPLSSQLFSQDFDMHSQQFTQHDTVMMSPTGSSATARMARGVAATDDGASSSTGSTNSFNPRMHASIMFSKSDRVLIGSEQPSAPGGPTNGHRAPQRDAKAAPPTGRAVLGDGYGQAPPFSQAYLTQESIHDGYWGSQAEGLAGASQFTTDGASQFTQDYSSQHFTHIEISDWEHISSSLDIHTTYGGYVRAIEYRRIRRRRGNSHNESSSAPASPPAVDSRTKTQVLCEWFGRLWEGLRQVTVGAWPPYNVYRIQDAIAASCPRLEVLVLEGAAAAWVDTLQRAIAAHPGLVGLHITEDSRALLPPAADRPYARTQPRFGFLECESSSGLTHLTVPCLADSVILLLGSLARLLPALTSLDLRQVDAGVASQLRVSLPLRLADLKIHGQHPLSLRMLGTDYVNVHSEYRNAKRQLAGISLQELAPTLRSLVVTGPRSEEAARSEHDQFWSALLQTKLPSLAKLVIPVVRPELGSMISQM
ncbi:hypothetical protein GGI03_007825, partial [Coemansia sp. RSA 2337]